MSKRQLQRVVTASTVALLLGACALGGEGYPSGVDPSIKLADTSAPVGVVGNDELPTTLADGKFVDPYWDAMPRHSSGVFVGFGQISDEALRISAVTSDGTILWTTERPLSCTGFTLTADADGRALAVLTDMSVGTTTVSVTTASAFDLYTGELVWGPVEVPGPHTGPGLVFSALPTGGAMGASGPRVALDPTSGSAAISEDDLDGVLVVGEYDGTLVLASDDHLVATDAQSRELWRLPLHELGLADVQTVATSPDVMLGAGFAFVGERDAGYALVDLGDGTVIAHAAQATATDPVQQTHITVEHDRLRAYTYTGSLLWEQPIDPKTRIAGTADGVIYLILDDRIHTRDAVTGDQVRVYGVAETVALPRNGNVAGAVVLETSQGLLLAIDEADDGTAAFSQPPR